MTLGILLFFSIDQKISDFSLLPGYFVLHWQIMKVTNTFFFIKYNGKQNQRRLEKSLFSKGSYKWLQVKLADAAIFGFAFPASLM